MTDEERLRKFVESIGVCSLYMQRARHYLQRASDFMRENRTLQMSDLFIEDRIARPLASFAERTVPGGSCIDTQIRSLQFGLANQ
jgi:hypothetical protein